jgi:carbon storage regulator
MLVLSRKVGEQIYVPQFKIVLTVLAVDGRRVSLGITAPKGISIVRQELLDRLSKPSTSPNESGGETTISLDELAALERGP